MKVISFYDIENEQHTLTLLKKGGPIISAPTLEEAKEKFKEAMKLAQMVSKMMKMTKYKRKQVET